MYSFFRCFSIVGYYKILNIVSMLYSENESEVAQSSLTLCDPMDCSLSCSSIHGIFQARVLEWIAISSSRGSSWPRNRTQVSRIAGRRFTVWATRHLLCSRSLLFIYFIYGSACVLRHSVMSDSLHPLDCSSPGSSVHGILRQKYQSGLPFSSPGYLPNPGIEPASSASPTLQADSLPAEPSGKQAWVSVNPNFLIYPSPPQYATFISAIVIL